MKHLLFVVVMLAVCVMVFSPPGVAQQPKKFTSIQTYNVHNLGPRDSVNFTYNTSDTFPRAGTYWATNSSTFKVGGLRYVDLEFIVKDTLQATFVVERRLPAFTGTAAGSWATVYSDSIVNYSGASANTGKRSVYYLRSPETDYLDGLPFEYRIRVTYSQYATVVGTSTPYIFPRLNWYP